MDLYPEFDTQKTNTLILTHHPPLFNPKTPTYTIHSNWDIINGGANEALAETLKLNVISPFDKTTNIGRICKTDKTFGDFEKDIPKFINLVNAKAMKISTINPFSCDDLIKTQLDKIESKMI